MRDPMELLEAYAKEIESDTQIDVTNVMEKQFSSPNVKHKWLYRLMKTKKDLLTLGDARDNFIAESMERDNPLQLSKAAITSRMGTNQDYRKLQLKIKDQELLVEYLEMSVNKIFSQIGFDFKNLVELMKMEQL